MLLACRIRLPYLVLFALATRAFAQQCAPTPAEAARNLIGDEPLLRGTEVRAGFRAEGTLWDPVLSRLWIRVGECTHPERPAILVPVRTQPELIPASSPASLVPSMSATLIHPGDRIALTYQRQHARMRLLGVSESSGGIGDSIRVRASLSPNAEPVHLSALIRTSLEAEVVP